ncbi:MAG: hypothetical protein J6039_01205 [Alphaproteobacteria bacterium]|nr:hypothetical protein [Alphaproteobacteria bacterium]
MNMKKILLGLALIATAYLPSNAGAANTMVYTNAFGGNVTLATAQRFSTNGDTKAFTVKYESIPQEACIDLAVQDWGSASGAGLLAIGINNATSTAYSGSCTSSYDTGKALHCGSSGIMSVANAAKACAAGEANYIEWKFY